MTQTEEPARLACRLCGRMAIEVTIHANEGKCMACVRAEQKAAFDAFHAEVASKGDWHVSNAAMLTLNKNTAYRDRILTSSHAVAVALQEAGLTTVDLCERYDRAPTFFYVVESDLTDQGKEFARKRLHKWYAKTDRWKDEVPAFEKFKASLAKECQAFAAG